ncbi:MAG: hypothetical protein AAB551_04170 [Patescibacteria group bacterium]
MHKKLLILGLSGFFVTFGIIFAVQTVFRASDLKAELLTQDVDDEDSEDDINIDMSAEAEKKMKQADRTIAKYLKAGVSGNDIRELKKIANNMHNALAEKESDGIFWDLWSEFEAKDNDIQDALNGDVSVEVDQDIETPRMQEQAPKLIEKPVKKLIQPLKVPVKTTVKAPVKPIAVPKKASGKISSPTPQPYSPTPQPYSPTPQPYSPTPQPYSPAKQSKTSKSDILKKATTKSSTSTKK